MERNKQSLLLLSIFLVLATFLGACSTQQAGTQPAETESKEKGKQSKYGGDFIIGSTGSPTTFNALYSVDTTSGAIQGFVFNGLLKTNSKLEFVGDLAKDWKVSEDGLTWTFHLREGVKFHDGVELTAEDVVFTYNIPLSEEYTGARGSDFEKIEKVEAIDKYTVKFTLKEKYAPFKATASYDIFPKHILKDVPVAELAKHPFNTKNPVGTGPFKFVDWKEGQYVKVKANENYFGGRPYLDTITFKIVPDANALVAQLMAGEVDHISIQSADLSTAQKLEEQGKINLESGLTLGYTYIGWNQRNPLFQDKKVRQALTHAINREAIVKSVLNGDGQVAHSTASPVSWSYTSDVPEFEYNPEKAKQLLAEAGWKDTNGDGILDKDGKPFEFVLNTPQGNKARQQISVIVQQQLKEVGIKATPRLLEWSAFVSANMKGEYDACINGWSLGVDPDQSDFFHSKHRNGGLNYTHHSNPELDKLLEKNVSILDKEKREKVLHKIYRLVSEDQPYTFLFYPNDHYAIPANLKGFEFHPSDPFYNINKWYFAN